MTGGVDRQALRELLQEAKRSARDVSRAAGLGETSVKDILSGKSKRPEFRTLQAIADQLGVPVFRFATAGPSEVWPSPNDLKIAPRFLPVRYTVKAGLWSEIEFEVPPVQISHAVTPDPRYANWPQWLELVEGDSVDRKIEPGEYAHVVDAIEMGYSPRDGDWVIVERRSDQGRKRERTIKRVDIDADGTVRLRPWSRNPVWGEHTTIVMKNGAPVYAAGAEPVPGSEIEVEIVGKVIGSYDPDF